MLAMEASAIMPSTRRQNHLDAISGLLIVQVVLLHILILTRCTENCIYKIVFQQILVFYMPWFFFKNGLFYRERNMKDAIQYVMRRLAKPYIVISVVSVAATILYYTCGSDLSGTFDIIARLKYIFWHGALAENLPLYFLLSLGLVRIVIATIDKFCGKNGSSVTLVASVISLIVLHQLHYRLPDCIINSFIGILFFSIGRLSSSLLTDNKIANIAAIIYLLTIIVIPSFVDFRTGHTVNGNFWIWVVISICGILSINKLFMAINKVFTLNWLSYIGRQSMAIYVIHFLLIFLLTRISVDYLSILEGTSALFGLVTTSTTIILIPLHKTINKII